jgi:glyoxylase-like metal-dependent hydrolase (beta-lactamase superfamily II)/ferredoxin
MANPKLRLPENVPGDFFVDDTCIDCDACRQIAPATFRDHGGQSSVYHQPTEGSEELRALMALVACPTGSIGAAKGHDARAGIDAFPEQLVETIYFCGFTAESSFGAWSYLITRPTESGGNLLIDSPRWAQPLARHIEALGGVATMFLSHRDDIADHAAYAATFGARRIMHADDGAARLGIEWVIEGEDPVAITDELTIIPVPGHTRGQMVLLYKEKYLFTGDHLAWSPRRNTLTAFRDACWYSWREQTRSMEKLLDYSFEWVLPGHGRIGHAPRDEMHEHLKGCVEWMKGRA